MSFRHSKAASHEAMKWREFIATNGYVDDGSGFSTARLDSDQRRALREVARVYVEGFEPDGDVDTYLGWLGIR